MKFAILMEIAVDYLSPPKLNHSFIAFVRRRNIDIKLRILIKRISITLYLNDII